MEMVEGVNRPFHVKPLPRRVRIAPMTPRASTLRREAIASLILTLVGAVLRLWSAGRLGLTHFDEGIYALAGLWSLSPHGLAALDRSIIAYAPPGLPILVGLGYLVLGVGDLVAIAPAL